MIEIYLFIHPLCPNCLTREKQILDTIQMNRKKIQFKFLPFINFQHFQQFLNHETSSTLTLNERNRLFKNSYDASLDYKAMLLQGKKKGRAFLFALQEEVGVKRKAYSSLLVDCIVRKIKGDLAMFHADRHSKLVLDSLMADQATAREMGVSKSGSMVIFNYTSDQDYGILLEDKPTNDLLLELLEYNTSSLIELTADRGVINHALMDPHHGLKLLEN